MIDRDAFFDAVREDPFGGNLTQLQVDGISYLLDVWERHFRDEDVRWLAYALATTFHETAQTMTPLEEYGRGSGKSYGEPVPPYGNAYYGRGFVQLTWAENYEKGERFLKERYGIDAPMYRYPHRNLEHETAALILYDGSINSWFTGVGLPDFFNDTKDDPYNARKVINGLDCAEKIAGYHRAFLAGLK